MCSTKDGRRVAFCREEIVMSTDSLVGERPADTRFSQAEWDVRVKLAAAYRLVEYFGWTELIYGHLTARVPGPEDHFLINPWGLNYEEVTASNLVKIDMDGNAVDGRHSVNFAGFIIHSAIHMTRSKDNHVIMHTHTRAGMAIPPLQNGLPPPFIFSTPVFKKLRYHHFK